jgi:hypothetical protein
MGGSHQFSPALSEEWVQRYREEKQAGWWTRFW